MVFNILSIISLAKSFLISCQESNIRITKIQIITEQSITCGRKFISGHSSEACKGFATCIVFVRYFTEKAPFMHVGGRFHISWQEIFFLRLQSVNKSFARFRLQGFQYEAVRPVDHGGVERCQINPGREFIVMAHAFADNREGDVLAPCNACP